MCTECATTATSEAPSPGVVLARIAADRKILALHQPIDNIYGR
jgi:hypothetical protein